MAERRGGGEDSRSIAAAVSVEFPFAARVESVSSAHPAPAAAAPAQPATATHGPLQDGSATEHTQLRHRCHGQTALLMACALSGVWLFTGFGFGHRCLEVGARDLPLKMSSVVFFSSLRTLFTGFSFDN